MRKWDGTVKPYNAGDFPLAMTQTEAAAVMGVTQRRVWELEQSALRKIRIEIEREAELAGVSVEEWLGEALEAVR